MLDEQIASARSEGFSDEQILNHLRQNKPDLAPKITQALSENFSASDILNHLAPQKASIGGNLMGGAAQVLADIAKTGEKTGFISKDTSKKADAIAKGVYGGKSGSERFYNGEKTLGSTAGALAEGVAPMAMDVGAGVAGAALGAAIGAPFAGVGAIPGAAIGGTIGSLAGYFGSDLLRNYGRRLEAREEANNGREATATDKAIAVATSAPNAVLNRFMVGKATPAVGLAERGAVDALGRVGTAAGAGAVGNALGDTVEQIGRNVGTEKGDTSIGQTVDSALLGAAGGAAFRGTAEAATAGRRQLSKSALRDYDHPDQIPQVAERLQQISDGNERTVGNRAHDALSLQELSNDTASERARNSRKFGNKAVDLAERNGIDTDTIAKAEQALRSEKPSVNEIQALQKVTEMAALADPMRAEGYNYSVDLAKRAATVHKLKVESNYTEKNGVPSIRGGLSGMAERPFESIKNALISGTAFGAGGLGAMNYAGYAGLGTLGSLTAATAKALPFLGGALGAYGGLKLIDKALNTNSPVSRFIEGGREPNVRVGDGGAALQQMYQRMAVDDFMNGRNAGSPPPSSGRFEAEAMPAQSGTQVPVSAKAQQALLKMLTKPIDEQAALQQMEQTALKQDRADLKEWWPKESAKVRVEPEYEGQRFRAEGIDPPPPPPNEGQMAKGAMDLAKAIQKLDILNGTVKDPSHYEGLTQLRMPIEDMQAIQERVKADLEVAKLKDTAAKALAKAAKTPKEAPKAPKESAAAPVAPIEEPKAPKQSQQNEPKKTETVEPKKTDAKEPTQADIDKRRAELIQQRRENFLSFETLIKGKFGEEGSSVVSHLQDHLNGSTNHGKPGLKAINELPEKFGEAGEYAKSWWLGKGKLENSRFGRMFFSRKLSKIIMTPKEAEKSRGF